MSTYYIIKILTKVKSLSVNPIPEDCIKLSGQERYRIRQGNCQILYVKEEDILKIDIVRVG